MQFPAKTGPRLPSEDVGRVAEPFESLHRDTTRADLAYRSFAPSPPTTERGSSCGPVRATRCGRRRGVRWSCGCHRRCVAGYGQVVVGVVLGALELAPSLAGVIVSAAIEYSSSSSS